jgi:hypothetical protein
MVDHRRPLDGLFDALAAKVKRLIKRVRKARRKWFAPKRPKRRRKPAASRAGRALAQKRWRAAKQKQTNVVPFKRRRSV